MSLYDEIFEQPAVLQRVIDEALPAVDEAARMIRESDTQYIFLAARGTSDNAARYANYLFGIRNGLPVALATPSLFSLYRQPPSLKGAAVIGISQSGRSPDIVSVLEESKRQGRPTLAITNAPDSPLAQAAGHVIDILAGTEAAVAATKTYTAQLLILAMLSTRLAGDQAAMDELRALPAWVEEALKLDAHIEQVCQRYRYMEQCVVLGRGYNYATAFEWSLKIKELTYTIAEPYSPADFKHGPMAIIDRGFPVLAVAADGPVSASFIEFLSSLKQERQAEIVMIANHAAALDLGRVALPFPAEVPEWLSPLVAIVPGQLFCYHLTRIKGLDPDRPRGLTKVTETQ